jgi:CRP-like cAMP-binding protein
MKDARETSVQDVHSNSILGQLSAGQLERLRPNLRCIEGPLGKVLIEQGQPSPVVFFPLRGAVLSLTRETESGAQVEIGVIGSEGIAAIAALLDPRRHLDRGMVQGPGSFMTLPTHVLDAEIARDPELRALVFRYINAFLMQIAQTAICNRLHPLEQRLARWLLMMNDRIEGQDMRLTQEFLSHMLGTRLAGVNEGIQSLARAGLIAHARQLIRVIDREGLEQAACECYAVARDEMRRVTSAS